jgi:hypothetical protein
LGREPRAHFDGDGPERRLVSFIGTVQDITERKEREEREHLLLRDVSAPWSVILPQNHSVISHRM